MINEQMITRGGKKGFLDDQGNFYPIDEPVTGQGGRPLGSTRPQRPSTSTPETSSTPEPTPKPTSANANRDGSRPGGGMTDAEIKAAQDKVNAERAALQQRNSSTKVDTGPFFDGAKGGKYDQTTTPAPTPTPTPTPTPAKTYKVDGKDMTAADIRKQYDALRYNKDGKLKPLKDLGDASGFGDRANRAVFPNQRLTRRMKNAATGDYNPRQSNMSTEAYDVVLDYLLSEGHVDTVEEAHYVMLQMTSEHVQEVVEKRTNEDV